MVSSPARQRDPAPSAPGAPGPPSRRGLAAAVVLGAVASALLLGGLLLAANRLSWVNRAPLADPVYGINFSCAQAEYLFLDGVPAPDRPAWCAAMLRQLLRETGTRHVRLSVEWSQVEPREGQFDFALVDALLAAAAEEGAAVLLTVGIKAQRHPEYYIPAWALDDLEAGRGATVTDDPRLRERALRMVEAVVRHVAPSPAIEAWGAENEPYVPSKRANYWRIGRDFVQEEIALIRRLDPRGRPVVVNQAQHRLWDDYATQRRWILEDADVLGMSFYPQRNFPVLGIELVVPIPELPLVHPKYPSHRQEAEAGGRGYWITELQAEPWVEGDMRAVGPDNPSPNLDREKLRANIEYARRTGASRVYLWGAEWWLYQRERYGDAGWLDLARETIASSPAGLTAGR